MVPIRELAKTYESMCKCIKMYKETFQTGLVPDLRKVSPLYSRRIREGVFPETRLPINGLLGNSGHEKSRDC
jgi:hypothetical protein